MLKAVCNYLSIDNILPKVNQCTSLNIRNVYFDKYIIVQEFWHAGHAIGLGYIQKNMLHGQQ